MTEETARFSQSRNDMYWTLFTSGDGPIRWIGYDDDFWWERVSPTETWRRKVGPTSGKIYTLDPHTAKVTIEEFTA